MAGSLTDTMGSLRRLAVAESGAQEGSMELDGTIYPLHVCAQAGDKAGIVHYLNGGYDVNGPDPDGRSPLVYAVVSGHLPCISVLVQSGAWVDQQDSLGLTPCHWAASHEQHKALAALLEGGANWTIPDRDGRSTLHYACTTQSSKCVSAIAKTVTAPDQLNLQDAEGLSAMHWATFHNRPKHIGVLLKYGASGAVADNEGKTPLLWAAENADPSCMMALLADPDATAVNKRDQQGRTPAHLAIAKGDVDMLEALLSHPGCEIDAADSTGRTLLHWAAAASQGAMVEALVARNVDTLLVDQTGATALHYAAQVGGPACVAPIMRLNKSAADVQDSEGRGALMWAVLAGNVDTCLQLLQSGANPNSVDREGRTALHLATLNDMGPCADVLLRHGADPNIPDGARQTPLFFPCEHNSPAMLSKLLAVHAAVDLSDGDERTPLHWAAVNGHDEIVDLLAQAGARLDCVDKDGKTPLAYACYQGHARCAKALISRGASIDLLDNEGVSALHWAALEGHKDVVVALVEAGAYINPMEVNGGRLTPLDYAMINNHAEVGRYLVEKGGLCISDIKVMAALSIQTRVRGFLARRRYSQIKSQAQLQSISGHRPAPPAAIPLAAVPARAPPTQAQAEHAATVLQSAVRGYLARKRRVHLAFSVRERARARREEKEKEKEKTKERERLEKSASASAAAAAAAAVTSEQAEASMAKRILATRIARRTLARKEQRRMALVRDCIRAATIIQRAFRNYLHRRASRRAARAPDSLLRAGLPSGPIRSESVYPRATRTRTQSSMVTVSTTPPRTREPPMTREAHFRLLMSRYDPATPTPAITGRLPRLESSRPPTSLGPSRGHAFGAVPPLPGRDSASGASSSTLGGAGGGAAAAASGLGSAGSFAFTEPMSPLSLGDGDEAMRRRHKALQASRILLHNAARSRLASHVAKTHKGWNNNPNITPPSRRRSQSPSRTAPRAERSPATITLPALPRRITTAAI